MKNRILYLSLIFFIASGCNTLCAQSKEDTVFSFVEQKPEYPGGMSELMLYLGNNIKYPIIAAENGIQGKVILQFVVTKNGKIQDAKVVRGIGGGCDEEAIRVVNAMPDWIPGKHSGKPVNVSFSLPINFKFNDEANRIDLTKEKVYEKVDALPTFIGGEDAMYKFIGANIRYPALAREMNRQGEVVIEFIVDRLGNMQDTKIKKGIGGGCDEEALRVLALLPKWQPAMVNGIAVNCRHKHSIKFRLAK